MGNCLTSPHLINESDDESLFDISSSDNESDDEFDNESDDEFNDEFDETDDRLDSGYESSDGESSDDE